MKSLAIALAVCSQPWGSVLHPLGHQVAECDANTANAAIVLVSLMACLGGYSGISIFHQVSWYLRNNYAGRFMAHEVNNSCNSYPSSDLSWAAAEQLRANEALKQVVCSHTVMSQRSVCPL